MISRELLYAILQGLPEKYLAHLDAPWPLIARRINIELSQGRDPISALKSAFARTGEYERQKIREALLQIVPVMQIPGLSYRQREALVALRSAKTASLAQLCRILSRERSNTYRSMSALVKKGLAIKFFQPGGVYYFAVPSRLEKSVKIAVNQFISELMKEFSVASTTSTTLTTRTTST